MGSVPVPLLIEPHQEEHYLNQRQRLDFREKALPATQDTWTVFSPILDQPLGDNPR